LTNPKVGKEEELYWSGMVRLHSETESVGISKKPIEDGQTYESAKSFKESTGKTNQLAVPIQED